MSKRNQVSVRATAFFVLAILAAIFARILGVLDILPKTMGILRSIVYIGVFIAWGMSVRQRIIGTRARRYLTAAAALMVLWFLVRSFKYYFVTQPLLVRYLWYLYYPALVLIPMLAVLTAISIGKQDDAPLPKSTVCLYLPAILLFLLVLTNDLHQLVFRFPADAAVWSDKNYSYGIGYVILVAWMFFCALLLLVILFKKRRVADKRKLILLPCIPIISLLLYLIFYVLELPWLRLALGDMTAVFCLMYAATLELFLKCGFLQANTHYIELFHASTVAAQITDADYRILLSSDAARNIETEILKQTEKEPLLLENGLRLSSAALKIGHVVWTEDISPLLHLLEKLEEMKEELEETNQLEEEEQKLRKHEAHILEQDRLYNILQRDTARQLGMMDEWIHRVEEAEGETEKRRLLDQILVIGSYLKRRSNLAFLSEKSSMLDAHELDLCFAESMAALEACGIVCAYRAGLEGQILAVHLISIYEFFERVVEALLDCECNLAVYTGKDASALYLKILTDATRDLAGLASNRSFVQEDEDGEQHLLLRLETGGGFA